MAHYPSALSARQGGLRGEKCHVRVDLSNKLHQSIYTALLPRGCVCVLDAHRAGSILLNLNPVLNPICVSELFEIPK